MSRPKIKFVQAQNLQELEDFVNRFLQTRKSLSAKYVGMVGGFLTMQIVYAEESGDMPY